MMMSYSNIKGLVDLIGKRYKMCMNNQLEEAYAYGGISVNAQGKDDFILPIY